MQPIMASRTRSTWPSTSPAAAARLVRAHQFGDRRPRFAPRARSSAPQRRDRGARLGRRRVSARPLAEDEPAADRAPGSSASVLPSASRATKRRYWDGAAGRYRVEADRAVGIEGDMRRPARLRVCAPRMRRRALRRIGIDGLRLFAGQAEDHRLVGACPRPVKASEPRSSTSTGRRAERARATSPPRRPRRLSSARPYGGRRPDPDLEQFEDADHGLTTRGFGTREDAKASLQLGDNGTRPRASKNKDWMSSQHFRQRAGARRR